MKTKLLVPLAAGAALAAFGVGKFGHAEEAKVGGATVAETAQQPTEARQAANAGGQGKRAV
jgi:hypothetical protein